MELPLTEGDLYRQVGIDPPRGVLLYGPPGTGKTMLAKAVAHHTTAAFIRVVGSEFVQKYLGEGPRMVRDVFRLAKENAPAIVFVDEVDAIATARFDAQTGADREVQRILMELLNQMDGFDQTVNVKVRSFLNFCFSFSFERSESLSIVFLRAERANSERAKKLFIVFSTFERSGAERLSFLFLPPVLSTSSNLHPKNLKKLKIKKQVIMATNRADTLDPALLRPGRLDRKIEFPLPDRRQKRLVFAACTAKMNLSDEVDLEDYVSRPDKVRLFFLKFSGFFFRFSGSEVAHGTKKTHLFFKIEKKTNQVSNADIAAICQEAGMHAVRKNRYVILPKDFEKGYRSNVKKSDSDFAFYT